MSNQTKQTKINFYTNIAALVANIIVGIYYTPYLVKSLGLVAYGVLPLALIINQYISVATQTLTHAYTRFYSVALQKGDFEEASKDISTSFVVVLFISAILVPIGILIIANADRLFKIPSVLLASSRILFGYTVLSFLVSLFSSLMNVTLYATNRLDLMNLMKIIRTVFKLGVVILLFESFRVDISLVGLTNLSTETLVLLISIFLFVKYKPADVKISSKYYDKKILISILSMSVWVLIQLCGDTLIYRTDNLILNHYWGTKASGALGAISEIGHYVSVIVSVLGSLFGPLILTAYAKGQHDEVKSLFLQQSTIVGCLSSILAGVISGCGLTLLNVWLGNNMGDYQWWLFFKMIVLPFYAAGGIFAFVYRSWNKMKISSIGSMIIGIVIIVLLVLLCEFYENVSELWILVIVAIASISQCYILNGVSVLRIYNDCKQGLFSATMKILLTFILSFCLGYYISHKCIVSNLLELGVLLLILTSVLLFIVYGIVLNKKEREKLVSIIR